MSPSLSDTDYVTLGNEIVSVILPFYNARETLRHAVFSVLNQTYKDWALVLLDDGSDDGSIETVIDLVDNERIFLVSDGFNRGLIYRLNQMVGITKAPFVARMDADDLIHPERFQKQMDVFGSQPQLDIVSTGMAIMNKSYQVVGVRNVDGQPTLFDFVKYGGLVHASCIFRREFLLQNRYDADFFRAEDRELFLRVLPGVQYYCVNEPLYFCMEYDCFCKEKYLDSYRTERKVILRHGPRLIGWVATTAFWGRSIVKSFVVHILAVFGGAQRITRRSSVVYRDEQSCLQPIVDSILTLSHDQSKVMNR